MNPKRLRVIKSAFQENGSIVYWMSRDQRVNDNWALISAYEDARNHQQKLFVIFCLSNYFPSANSRHYDFMLKGLQEVDKKLSFLNIPFKILIGDPAMEVDSFVKENSIKAIYCDFDPLRIKIEWKNKLLSRLSIPVYEVDAHNIVPCWIASQKQEFAARTFRPKINRLLPEFSEAFPSLKALNQTIETSNNWYQIFSQFKKPDIFPTSLKSGSQAASNVLDVFIQEKLENYEQNRNHPDLDALSNLSAYLHFGQISAQRIASNIRNVSPSSNTEAFLEELIIRRELSDNFCFYNKDYDSLKGAPHWAIKTLEQHFSDKREKIYTLEEFENASTHDHLWNSAQNEMVKTGKMHGYMRMYWAKKILEWTENPEIALQYAIYLNDKFSLDGRDPNGYVGCLWAIAGLHDRPWGERPVFGTIRYMNAKGCSRKFDVNKYIRQIEAL